MKKLFLSFFSLAFCLVALELALRVFGYEGSAFRETHRSDFRFGDVPSQSWALKEPRPSDPEIEVNWEKIPIVKPQGEIRILFIGDSGTYGTHVSSEQIFSTLVGHELKKRLPGQKIHVVNAAVPGMATVNEYVLLRDRLLALKPDVVVLGVFMANDLNFNLKYERLLEEGEAREGAFSHLVSALRPRSALVDFTFLRWEMVRYKMRWGTTSSGLYPFSYPEGEIATYESPPSAPVERAFSVMERVLGHMSALAKERHFRLLPLLIPTTSRLASKIELQSFPWISSSLTSRGILNASLHLDFEQPTRRVLEICSSLPLTCIDPVAKLKGLGQGAFNPKDDHLSPSAHQAVSESILPDLLTQIRNGSARP